MDSFLDLRPLVEIILNIDSDHLDYFKDIDHIAKSFGVFTDNLRDGGFIVAFDSNPFVKAVTEKSDKKVVYFGFNESSDYYAKNITFNDDGHPSYDLYSRNGYERRIELGVPGEHNVANSLAAVAACMNLGVSLDVIEETLESFRGTQRRFDIIGKTENGCMVVDDYAHHPTEIKATLAAAQHFTHKTVWCLFQPHTYTRTLALMDEFADAFADADKVVFAEIYAAREKNIYKVSSKSLMDKVKERHPDKDVFFFDSFEKIADFVKNNASDGDMIITMGAGDIYKVGEMILGND
jgi:UDP-N-acetylmuramate--alanine ligase